MHIINRGEIFITGSNFINNSVTEIGGVMYAFAGKVSIIDSNFMNNFAGDFGGVVCDQKGAFYIKSSDIFLQYCQKLCRDNVCY